MARGFVTGVTTAAFLWFASAPGLCGAATGAEGGVRDDEVPPDLDYIRAKAEAGVAKAQTLLADYYTTAGDLTNAVLWYRKAAAQDEVGAQLTLASFLVTGQGTAKNPTEAARWLREAARLIESPASKPRIEGAARTPTNAEGVSSAIVPAPAGSRNILITKTTVAPSSSPPTTISPAPSSPAPVASVGRVQRVHSLSAATLVLQESPPVVKSYSDSH